MAASIRRVTVSSSQIGRQILARCQSAPLLNFTPVMFMRGKPWNPKYKKQRAQKTMFFDPHYLSKESDERKFIRARKEGKPPESQFTTRSMTVSESSGVMPLFVPNESVDRTALSRVSKQSVVETGQSIRGKIRTVNYKHRILRKYEDNYDLKELAHDLQDIYIRTLELLQDVKKNEAELHTLLTNKGYAEMTDGLENKTLKWNYIDSIRPPKSINLIVEKAIVEENLFAQIVVRIHTKQTIALYDRFGRLMAGGPEIVKNVLEYVVFEKHIVNLYGRWRIHGKIEKDWLPAADPEHRTIVINTGNQGKEVEPEDELVDDLKSL